MPTRSPRNVPATVVGAAIDDLRSEFGDRWDITAIAQGYRAVLKDHTGHTPVALYGRTPGELAESIRVAEVSR